MTYIIIAKQRGGKPHIFRSSHRIDYNSEEWSEFVKKNFPYCYYDARGNVRPINEMFIIDQIEVEDLKEI